ncbi:MAG: LD-carboxypeptidase [Oligoflexales bacterium]|nr:LD-carboxypeptidase [Oligoflexales bacterium]
MRNHKTPARATIRLLFPASRAAEPFSKKIEQLEGLGFKVLYEELPPSPWPYISSDLAARASALEEALLEEESQIILCGRGGYGSAEILPLLPWTRLKKRKPKLLVGFSDIVALHSALFTKLGWKGLHAPMPATALWPDSPQKTLEFPKDIQVLLNILSAQTSSVKIAAHRVSASGSRSSSIPQDLPLQGTLFGGCLSILCSLMGTPYFPKSLKGSLIFLEDVHESPPQVLRSFHHLLQNPATKGVRAFIVGRLTEMNLPENTSLSESDVLMEMARHCPVPLFASPEFGHAFPNIPLMIGATGLIQNHQLQWDHLGHLELSF